jgi:hypothetical protein
MAQLRLCAGSGVAVPQPVEVFEEWQHREAGVGSRLSVFGCIRALFLDGRTLERGSSLPVHNH